MVEWNHPDILGGLVADSHRSRMAEAGKSVVPEAIKRLPLAQTPTAKLAVKANWERTQALFQATMSNGAGLPMDKALRYYYQEYCHRHWEHGIEEMPTSFNVMEAFFRHERALISFSMLPEKDHQFDGLDFLDFATGPDVPADALLETYRIREGEIYSYNRKDPVDSLLLNTGDGKDFGFAGASMVRRGDEVVLLLLGGVVADLEAKTKELRELHFKMLRNITQRKSWNAGLSP